MAFSGLKRLFCGLMPRTKIWNLNPHARFSLFMCVFVLVLVFWGNIFIHVMFTCTYIWEHRLCWASCFPPVKWSVSRTCLFIWFLLQWPSAPKLSRPLSCHLAAPSSSHLVQAGNFSQNSIHSWHHIKRVQNSILCSMCSLLPCDCGATLVIDLSRIIKISLNLERI